MTHSGQLAMVFALISAGAAEAADPSGGIIVPGDTFEQLGVILIALQKIIALVVGYLTIRLGYTLVRSGLTGGFKWTSEGKGVKVALESSSPGLFFVLMGAGIIAWALFVEKPVTRKFSLEQATAPEVELMKPPAP